ncbi:PREDICTED: putative chondrosarcoma-associated gene 1 protein [Mandrillus leucophaeus]|uniref:putative chondrosarcoma-associated gene 1 protein n=1 Tax=Mandrillus leucophaeus TaxID=9568 RepID=UPI0005F37AAB|nr:PREDICTED: putative chondrosarcoma-associated gene 1 protein [Mandrillus leucophaeus]
MTHLLSGRPQVSSGDAKEAWGDQVDWSRLLRDAGVVKMSRKPRASSPLSKNHPPTPKRFPRQRGREKGPAKEVPGTKVSP